MFKRLRHHCFTFAIRPMGPLRSAVRPRYARAKSIRVSIRVTWITTLRWAKTTSALKAVLSVVEMYRNLVSQPGPVGVALHKHVKCVQGGANVGWLLGALRYALRYALCYALSLLG